MPVVGSEIELLLENLRTAYLSESNAASRYSEFAAQADEEGWCGVGCLFRAAAIAERIHASNYARIFRELDGPISCMRQKVETGITRENLSTALAEELFEAEIMYPTFIEQAQECNDVAAVRTFSWALEAEKTHARLFNEALSRMEPDQEESWIKMPRYFYVCPVCGNTSEQENETELCHVCNRSWKRFGAMRELSVNAD
jgi:rubrerythrin